jgi:hypothetical protein
MILDLSTRHLSSRTHGRTQPKMQGTTIDRRVSYVRTIGNCKTERDARINIQFASLGTNQ